MPLWSVEPVEEQPELTLHSWRVFETETGERHLVGWCEESHEGRVSSAIEGFDAQGRRAVTRSGRVYELSKRPATNMDAEYVWTHWKARNGVAVATDVTLEVWALMQAAGPTGDGLLKARAPR